MKISALISNFWLRHLGAKDKDELKLERSFLPAALEIIETPPSPSGRMLLWIICAFIVIVTTWSILSSIDIVAVASGKTVTHLRTQIVQAPQAGVVNAILVSPGQEVKDGDALVLLDKSTFEAEANRARSEYDQSRLDVARIDAFLDDKLPDPFSKFTDLPVSLVEHARSQLKAQRLERDARLASINKEIDQRKSELDAAKEDLDKISLILPLVQERTDMKKKVATMLYGNKVAGSEAMEKLLEVKSEKKTAELKIRSLEFAIQSLNFNLIQADNDYRRNAFSELNLAKQKMNTAAEAMTRTQREIELSTIQARVDGVVAQMQVRTVGGFVTPAQQLLSIVPKNSELEIEAVISNQDIGFIIPNQDVAIKFDAFPFTRFGMMKGKVISINQDSELQPIQTQQMSSGTESQADQTANIERSDRLVYMARISLSDESKIEIEGRPVALIPGMAVRAEIITGRRSVMSYLLSPLKGYASQTLQER